MISEELACPRIAKRDPFSADRPRHLCNELFGRVTKMEVGPIDEIGTPSRNNKHLCSPSDHGVRAESPRVSCSLAAPRAASRQPRYRPINPAFLPCRALTLGVRAPRVSPPLLTLFAARQVLRLNHRHDRRCADYRWLPVVAGILAYYLPSRAPKERWDEGTVTQTQFTDAIIPRLRSSIALEWHTASWGERFDR